MARIVRTAARMLFALAILYALLAATVGIGFDYLAPIDNEPLKNPVGVTSVSGNRLRLEDGRVVEISEIDERQLRADLQESGNRIELVAYDAGLVVIYVKKKHFICGLGAPLITIPLRRNEYPAYNRVPLGSGEIQ